MKKRMGLPIKILSGTPAPKRKERTKIYLSPYYFTINEVLLSLSTLFTLAPFSIKILATSTLPFIDAKILKGKKT